MKTIIISVVLPCYNVEQHIRRGLDSLLVQTLQEWEAILVDDGATDRTGKICEEYAAKDCRFRVIHQEKQGASCARNNGMNEAKGELIYFMDSDDWIEPNCLERCLETYNNHHCDIVQFENYWVSGNKKSSEKDKHNGIWNHEQIIREYTGPMSGLGQKALNAWYNGENLWDYKRNLGIWCFMFRRSFIESNHLHFMKGVNLFEDVLFAIEATYYAETIVSIPDILYNYDIREEGTVQTHINQTSKLLNDKWNLIAQRARLRKLVMEFDLHNYYLGSHVLSCLQLALRTADEWRNYGLYRQYVTHPDVQESIKKVCLQGAPMKFSIPVRLLKMHGQFLLFAGCWLLHKLRISNKISL